MHLFRAYVTALSVTLVVYTAIVAANHGTSFTPVFFGDVGAMTWPGQFNADFAMMLDMGAVWIAWRHGFSPTGLLPGPTRAARRSGE